MLRKSFFLLVLFGAAAVFGAPPPEDQRPPRPPEQFRRGPGFWRAFSQLSDAERQELLKLQRSDPEKFRRILEEKAVALYQQELKRSAELRDIVAAYRDTSDDAKRQELRDRLHQLCSDDFARHLAEGRRQLEEMKKRVARIEQELDQREKRRAEIIDAQVDGFLSGSLPLPRPARQPRPPQECPPPAPMPPPPGK